MPIRAVDPVCPQVIGTMRATLFSSGMLCVTNIPSINGNNTLFYSELSGKHTGESFMLLSFIVFKICLCKLKNSRFCENLTFDISELGQILTQDEKTHQQSQVLVERNPLVFQLSSTTLSLETRGGSYQPHVRVTQVKSFDLCRKWSKNHTNIPI